MVLRLLPSYFSWQCGLLLDWDSDENIQGPKHLINMMVLAAIFEKWVVEGQAFIHRCAMVKFQTKILVLGLRKLFVRHTCKWGWDNRAGRQHF